MIYVDMDGVLADFVGGAAEVFGEPANMLKARWPKGQYDIAEVLGVSTQKLWQEIDREQGFWSGLVPLLDGIELIAKLDDLGEPWTIATATSLSSMSAAGKMIWLQQRFGRRFRNYVLIPNKHLLCSGPGDILIDDSELNISRWRACGGIGYLVPRPWNSAPHDEELNLMLPSGTICHRWNNPKGVA